MSKSPLGNRLQPWTPISRRISNLTPNSHPATCGGISTGLYLTSASQIRVYKECQQHDFLSNRQHIQSAPTAWRDSSGWIMPKYWILRVRVPWQNGARLARLRSERDSDASRENSNQIPLKQNNTVHREKMRRHVPASTYSDLVESRPTSDIFQCSRHSHLGVRNRRTFGNETDATVNLQLSPSIIGFVLSAEHLSPPIPVPPRMPHRTSNAPTENRCQSPSAEHATKQGKYLTECEATSAATPIPAAGYNTSRPPFGKAAWRRNPHPIQVPRD